MISNHLVHMLRLYYHYDATSEGFLATHGMSKLGRMEVGCGVDIRGWGRN